LSRLQDQHISVLGIEFEVSPFGLHPDPPEDDAAVELWRDTEGTVCARSYLRGDCAWIDVLGSGLFRFDLASRKVTASPEAGASADLVSDTYLRVVLPIGLSCCGYEVLHASAVLTGSGVVGFCATSGTGKSTLAAALCRKGHHAFADDALVLDFDARRPEITALSVPFSLRLKQDSYLRSTKAGAQCVGTSSPLAALCVLERGPLPPSTPQMIRLAPTAAFSALLPHTYHLSLGDPAQKRRILSRYLDLVAQVPVYRLTFAADFSWLQRLAEVVEESIAAGDRGATAPVTRFPSLADRHR
jgi:hypothetical protein